MIDLSKNQTINLAKGTCRQSMQTKFFFGANWGKIQKVSARKFGVFGGGVKTESVDLDICSFAISGGKVYDECSYRYPRRDFMIAEKGDDRAGDSVDDNEDNECISIDLSKIPDHVTDICLIINSYSGQKFDEIPFASVRIYEGMLDRPQKVHATFNLANDPSFQGARTLIVGVLSRTGNGWDFTANGETRTYHRINDFLREVNG